MIYRDVRALSAAESIVAEARHGLFTALQQRFYERRGLLRLFYGMAIPAIPINNNVLFVVQLDNSIRILSSAVMDSFVIVAIPVSS